MKLMNIGSGSTGNATYVGNGSTHILIDTGLSRKKISEGLSRLNLTLKDMDAILITHEHYDHVKSIGMIGKSVEVPVWATEGTLHGIRCGRCYSGEPVEFRTLKADESFNVGDIRVTPLRTNHDAMDPVCYRFDDAGSACAVVTDLGDFDDYLVTGLQNLDAILIEANHDIRMLEVGPYPYPIKRRILGQFGHLSNERCGQLLTKVLNENVKHVLLGHLSRENNTEELAMLSVCNEIDFSDSPLCAADFDIRIAKYNCGSDILVF